MADLIPSFTIDHTRIVPGIYESRVDTIGNETVTTYDIRMKTPNKEPAIGMAAAHTIEHVIATYLRNHEYWKDQLVYWGPMGCLTGFYMIVKGRPAAAELCPIMVEAFEHLAAYEGEVPGATPVNCGNYLMHDLPMARWEAARYADYLRHADPNVIFTYPQTDALTLEDGAVFFDS